MTNVQIKNVPESTHALLKLRAKAARQSLQEYLLGQLTTIAATPSLDEVLDRAATRNYGITEDLTEMIRQNRDSR